MLVQAWNTSGNIVDVSRAKSQGELVQDFAARAAGVTIQSSRHAIRTDILCEDRSGTAFVSLISDFF